jgi:thiol-disulfide isomerase/thioredoxin
MPAFSLMLSAQTPVDYSVLRQEIQAAQKGLREEEQAQRKAGKPVDQIRCDVDKALQPIRARAKDAQGELKEACLIAELLVVASTGEARELGTRVMKEVAPDSAAWKACDEQALPFLFWILPAPSGEAYIQQLGEKGLPEIRPTVLAGYAENLLMTNKVEAAKPLVAKLQAQYPGHASVEKVAALLAGELATTVGMQAPDFSLRSLDHPEETFTKATFKGKYLLIDFWGTWCGWCIHELPATHKVYAAYDGKGLEILSLAADKIPEDVRKFRQKPGTPMPWKHAFIGTGKDQDAVVKAYGVQGFPSLFLIGPDGKVLAKGNDLREEGLEKTLAMYLK